MLPKRFRLSREEFKNVMKGGRMASGGLMGILLIQNSLPAAATPQALQAGEFRIQNFPKAGIIVSKKLSNKAVVRNKLKRRLRAALQIVLPEIQPEMHFVVLPNRRALTATVKELEEETREVLQK